VKKSADAVLLDNLRREMSKRHLSETDIAHRSGLSVSSIKALLATQEGGESASLAKLQRFADALGMSASQLLAEPEDAGAPVRGAPVRATSRAGDATPKQLGQLIEDFFVLPEADRRALLAHASDMASKYRAQVMR
jgi:transcriptional regulator with XRE-family HTH domain